MKSKFARLIFICYIFLLLLIRSTPAPSQIMNEMLVQDTTRQDSIIVKSDSILKKIPEKIISDDTTFQLFLKSPWQMAKSTMNQYFYEDLGDLLNYFPGVYLLDFGSSGQQLGWSRHGAKEQQVALFFDGHPFYDPIFGGIDLNLVPVGFTKTITIEQGLSSHFVTSSAEVISLQSDQYEEETPYSQVGYHKAPYGFSDIDIVFGRRISKRMNLLLGGIIKSFDGKNDSYSFEQQNFRGKVDYQLNPAWQFTYSWISNKITRHIPNPIMPNASYSLTDATQKVSRLDQTLNIKGRIFKADFRNFQTNLFYSSVSDKLKDKNFGLQFDDPGRYAGFNMQLQHQLWGQRITTGSNFIYEWTDADQVGKNDQAFGSIFIQDDWDLKERLGMRLLGSYQLHQLHDAQFTGGLSSFFSFTKNAKVTASVKQSLRYPTLFELNSKTDFKGNPALKAESYQKIELTFEWNMAPKFSLNSSCYYKTIEHAIYLYPLYSVGAVFLNQKELKYAGCDVQLRWALLSRFQLNMLFSVIDNSSLANLPNINFTGYLQYSGSLFQNDLRPTLRLEGRYWGATTSEIGHPYHYQIYQKKLEPAFIINTHAIFDFGNLKIFLTLENIFNNRYELIYGYPMNGRTLHYGLRWEFWN